MCMILPSHGRDALNADTCLRRIMQISHQEQIMSRQDQIMSRQEQIMSTIAKNHLDLIERLDRYLKTGKDHLHRSLETPDQEQKAEVSSPVSEEITNLRIALESGSIVRRKIMADSGGMDGQDGKSSSLKDVGPCWKPRSISVGSVTSSSDGLQQSTTMHQEGPPKDRTPYFDDSTNQDVLDELIRALRQKLDVERSLQKWQQAEQHLTDLIQCLQEQYIYYGEGWADWQDAQRQLVDVYHELGKGQEARQLIDDRLQTKPKPGESSVVKAPTMLDAGVKPEMAQWYFRSARDYLERYRSTMKSTYLDDAERDAKRAFKCGFESREAPEDPCDFNPTVSLLIAIYEAKGKLVHMDTYRKLYPPPSKGRDSAHSGNSPRASQSGNSSASSDTEYTLLPSNTTDTVRLRSLDQPLGKALCLCCDGPTAVIDAIDNEDASAIRKLHHDGAQLDRGLWHAVRNGKADMVRLLLELDTPTETKDVFGATPLLVAAGSDQASVVRILLNSQVKVKTDAKDDHGWSVVHYAAHNGNVEVMRILVEPRYRVDKNAVCLKGMSALHNLAETDNVVIGEMLLQNCADAAIKDKTGRTPLDIAIRLKRRKFVELLLKHNIQFDRASLPKTSQEINNLLDTAERSAHQNADPGRPALPQPRSGKENKNNRLRSFIISLLPASS